MKRVLIDLTDIELWNGIHGGIQRVVYGITKNFYLQDMQDFEVRYIAFSPEEQKFHYTAFEPIYNRVEGKDAPVDAKLQPQPALPPISRKELLKNHAPGWAKNNTVIRKSAGRTYNLASRAASRITRRSQTVSQNPEVDWVEFGAEDVVLILGKPWDDTNIHKTLAKEKQAHGFKLVQVVYDLVICLQPQMQNPVLIEQFTEHMVGAIKSSDLMLCISKSTEKDLKQLCEREKLKLPRTKVIRLGDDIVSNERAKSMVKPDKRIAKKFIACIGTIEIRKNHVLLYYAYKLAVEKGIELPQLVIIGSPGWLTGDIQHLLSMDPYIQGKIIVLNNVADEGLVWIYQNCQFTVYPSMYEGWGLPIAESLAYGKLCLASNSSSMTEIAGDLIDYFSPYNSERCMQKIIEYTNNTKLAAKEKRIRESYKITSWEQTYRQTVESIKSMERSK